jgi:hypothetical protein
MNTTQPEAQRLADALEDDLSELGVWGQDIADSAAAELRRLHIVNQELVSALYAVISLTGIDRMEAEEEAYELLGKME